MANQWVGSFQNARRPRGAATNQLGRSRCSQRLHVVAHRRVEDPRAAVLKLQAIGKSAKCTLDVATATGVIVRLPILVSQNIHPTEGLVLILVRAENGLQPLE